MLLPASGAQYDQNESLIFEIIQDLDQLAHAAPQWDALWERTPGARFSEHPTWCVDAWNQRGAKSGIKLAIILARRGGGLKAVVAMATQRRFGAPILIPLTPGGSQYTPILIAPEEDAKALARALLSFLRSARVGVIFRAPLIPKDSPLALAMLERGSKIINFEVKAKNTAWDDISSWEAFLSIQKSSRHLSEYRRQRRKLAELWTVTLGEDKLLEQKLESLEWIFKHKLEWMDLKNKVNPSLQDSKYYDYLRESAISNNAEHGLKLFSIRVDDKIIASTLSSFGNNIYEGLILTYDHNYSKYSPGVMIMQDFLQHSFEKGASVDMRTGGEAWKQDWANRDYTVISVYAPLTWVGALLSWVLRLQNQALYYGPRLMALVKSKLEAARKPASPRIGA